MKKSDIGIGKSYSNGRGRIRKVIDFGPQYKLYEAQESEDCLLYEIVNDGSKSNRLVGKRYPMTLASFALWAKTLVNE